MEMFNFIFVYLYILSFLYQDYIDFVNLKSIRVKPLTPAI